MAEASRGVADAYVLRPADVDRLNSPAHQGELLFGFVLEGTAVLEREGDHPLCGGDAFVIPAGEAWGLRRGSKDLELLQVVVPAAARCANP
jgi:mannose-6-phosphate isomerase-like protein (cupin superfamily)